MALHPPTEPYEVYARHGSEGAAHHIGLVNAAGPADAGVFAATIFDERRWAELFVVPRAAFRTVIATD